MILIREYATLLLSMASAQLQLVQTQVSKSALRRLDALARATGTSRSRYVGKLISMHLRAMPSSRLARALSQVLPDPTSPAVGQRPASTRPAGRSA